MITMTICLILSNLLWFLITAYLIWFVTGRPQVPGMPKKDQEPVEPEQREATDEEILKNFKKELQFNPDELPEVEDKSVE